MLKLEDIKIGSEIAGLIQNELATVIAVNKVGENALTVYYKTHSGEVKEQLLFRDSEATPTLAHPEDLNAATSLFHGLLNHFADSDSLCSTPVPIA